MQIVAYLDVASKHLAIKSSLVAYLFVVYHNNNFKDQIFLRRCRKWFFDDFSQSRCGKTNKKYETLSAKSLWTSFASFRLLLLFAPKNNFWNVRFLIKLQPLQLSNFKDSLSQTYWAHRPKNIFLSLSPSLSLSLSRTHSLSYTHTQSRSLSHFVCCLWERTRRCLSRQFFAPTFSHYLRFCINLFVATVILFLFCLCLVFCFSVSCTRSILPLHSISFFLFQTNVI